nr:LuxR C-terminal-related transcriptional regulator [uncultured Roseococcus sp.]
MSDLAAALVEGKANIGLGPDIGPRTVEVYRAHLMEKLGVPGLPEAVRIRARGRALERGASQSGTLNAGRAVRSPYAISHR